MELLRIVSVAEEVVAFAVHELARVHPQDFSGRALV